MLVETENGNEWELMRDDGKTRKIIVELENNGKGKHRGDLNNVFFYFFIISSKGLTRIRQNKKQIL